MFRQIFVEGDDYEIIIPLLKDYENCENCKKLLKLLMSDRRLVLDDDYDVAMTIPEDFEDCENCKKLFELLEEFDPQMNVYEKDENLVIVIATKWNIPVGKIRVTLKGNYLIIRGIDSGAPFVKFVRLSRVGWTPEEVDMDSFRVRFRDGIMKFIIPRKKDSKKEKIQGVIRREVSFF